jgi:putative ABC transport system ATP-binding protein
VVADEPTAHLDHIQVEGVLTLVRGLATPGRLVLVSTHDDRLTHIADRVIELVPHFSGADREPEEIGLQAGEVLFHQGERGDLVYVVEEGEIEIYRIRADGDEEPVAVVGQGDYFGELGPMFNLPRSASARARTPSRVTACTLRAFRRRFPGANSASAPTEAID